VTYTHQHTGWDFSKKKEALDLDASIMLCDKNMRVLDCVSYKKKQSSDGAVVHSGDNRTGKGEGDDEQVRIDTNTHASRML
jgi:stress response protein SCP2